jgi:hypothetical protein
MDPDGRYSSTVLPGFWFRVDWVLSAEPPDVLKALAQVVGPQKLAEAMGLEEGTRG